MKIKIDEEAFKAAGLEFRRDNAKQATFTFPDRITHHGEALSVGVEIDGDELWFFPERQVTQRAVLAAIGNPYVAPPVVERDVIHIEGSADNTENDYDY